MANRTVAVDLVARVSSYVANVKTAGSATKQLGTELDELRKRNAAGYQEIANSMLKVGGALALVAGWAVKTALEFDKAMSEVKAITGGTADEMDRLRQAALDAGSSTVFSATEVATAEAELAKAGLTTSQILSGALAGSLAMAAAGSISLAEAATTAANTMNQFGLAGKDVGHIADLMAGAANATTADVKDLALALSMGGGAAHAAGMDLQETLVALGALSKAALNGSDAGTSLKTMLLALETPTVQARKLMELYGFEVYDAQGQMVDLYQIAGRLKTAFGGLTEEQRNAALGTIFGSDAMRTAVALYNQGSEGLAGINKQLLAQADAAGVAATKTDNLSGDLGKLKGKLDSLFIGSSEGANGGLRILVQVLDHLVGEFSNMPGPIQSAIVVLAGATGAALLAGAAFMKLRASASSAVLALTEAGTVSAATATRMRGLAATASRAGVVLGTVAIATTALDALLGDHLVPDLQATALGLEDYARSGKAAGDAAKAFGADLSKVRDALLADRAGGLAAHPLWADPGEVGIVKNTNALKAFDDALAEMVRNGHAEEASRILQELSQDEMLAGVSGDRLYRKGQQAAGGVGAITAQLPGYSSALQTAAGAAGEAATATGQAGAAAETQAALADAARRTNIQLAGAFGRAASEANGLKTEFDRLNGAFLEWQGAEANVEQALADLKESFKENGRTLDNSTEKGRNNTAALIDYATATRDAMQAKMDETGNVQAANKVYEEYRQKLLKLLATLGIVGKAAQDFVNTWLGMPSAKTITITVKYKVTGAGTAAAAAEAMDPMHHADGGMVEYYARGGEHHVAQIAPAGVTRVWNEPETEGEAYIPLALSKRARSSQILADVAKRFNMPMQTTLDTRGIAAAMAGQREVMRPEELSRAMRSALQGMVVVMDSHAVGRVQGRQADVLARTF